MWNNHPFSYAVVVAAANAGTANADAIHCVYEAKYFIEPTTGLHGSANNIAIQII